MTDTSRRQKERERTKGGEVESDQQGEGGRDSSVSCDRLVEGGRDDDT